MPIRAAVYPSQVYATRLTPDPPVQHPQAPPLPTGPVEYCGHTPAEDNAQSDVVFSRVGVIQARKVDGSDYRKLRPAVTNTQGVTCAGVVNRDWVMYLPTARGRTRGVAPRRFRRRTRSCSAGVTRFNGATSTGRIAYTSDGMLFAINLDGSNPQRLYSDADSFWDVLGFTTQNRAILSVASDQTFNLVAIAVTQPAAAGRNPQEVVADPLRVINLGSLGGKWDGVLKIDCAVVRTITSSVTARVACDSGATSVSVNRSRGIRLDLAAMVCQGKGSVRLPLVGAAGSAANEALSRFARRSRSTG